MISKDKIYTAIGVLFLMGGWMLFPIGYAYVEEAMMSKEEKEKIETEKEDRKKEILIYEQSKEDIEQICGSMPDKTVLKGSSGDRFTEAEEWEEPVEYSQEIEDYWMECAFLSLRSGNSKSTILEAVKDIQTRHKDFDIIRVHSYLKYLKEIYEPEAERLNNPAGWEYLWVKGSPQKQFKEISTPAQISKWLQDNAN